MLYIIRGIPGSGKSTRARELAEQLGDKAVVCEADEFRVDYLGRYQFREEDHDYVHQACFDKAKKVLEEGGLRLSVIPLAPNEGIKNTFKWQSVSDSITRLKR